jgi:hypothetical protein
MFNPEYKKRLPDMPATPNFHKSEMSFALEGEVCDPASPSENEMFL